MLDFKKLLALTNSEFWDLDDDIKSTLVQINKYSEIQTLYSKKYKCDPDNINLGGESYLEITSTKESWTRLLDKLNEIKNCLTDHNLPVEISSFPPRDNPNFNANSKFDIGCIKDPDYFRINHLKISMESSDLIAHDKFWECIASKFAN